MLGHFGMIPLKLTIKYHKCHKSNLQSFALLIQNMSGGLFLITTFYAEATDKWVWVEFVAKLVHAGSHWIEGKIEAGRVFL